MKKKSDHKQPWRPSFGAMAAAVIVAIVAGVALFSVLSSRQAQAQAIARLAELSNRDSGATLSEVVETIQTEKPQVEIIFVFDKDGNKLIEYTNNGRHSVSLPDEALELLRQFDGLTHVHNHPFTDSGHSDGDLVMPARVGLKHSIATLVVIGQKHVFYMDRGKQSWPSFKGTMNYFALLMGSYDPESDPAWMRSVVVDGTEGEYYTDDCLSRFAEDWGYTFEVVNPATIS